MCHASCKSTNFSTTPPIFEAKASPPRELWSFPQAFLFFAFKFPWVLRPDGAAGLAVFRAAIKATEGNGNHPPFGGFGGDKTISTDVSFGGLWFSSWQLFFWFGTKKSKESFFWIWLPCFWRRCCFCNRFHSAKGDFKKPIPGVGLLLARSWIPEEQSWKMVVAALRVLTH